VNIDGLLDSWGNPYKYLHLDSGSVAPLTSKKSQDDIVSANNDGYTGLAENY